MSITIALAAKKTRLFFELFSLGDNTFTWQQICFRESDFNRQGVDIIECTNSSQRAINDVVARRTRRVYVRTTTHTRAHTHTYTYTLGADTSALQKRDDHANSIFAPWWNDHAEVEGTACVPIWPRCLNCHMRYSIIREA